MLSDGDRRNMGMDEFRCRGLVWAKNYAGGMQVGCLFRSKLVGSEITWDSPKYEKRGSISVPSVVVFPSGHHSCD